jgi:hypothetical protein
MSLASAVLRSRGLNAYSSPSIAAAVQIRMCVLATASALRQFPPPLLGKRKVTFDGGWSWRSRVQRPHTSIPQKRLMRTWTNRRDWGSSFYLSRSRPGASRDTCGLVCLDPGGRRTWVSLAVGFPGTLTGRCRWRPLPHRRPLGVPYTRVSPESWYPSEFGWRSMRFSGTAFWNNLRLRSCRRFLWALRVFWRIST